MSDADLLYVTIVGLTNIVAIGIKAWVDRGKFREIHDRVETVHAEVKSPNGQQTGTTVNELKGRIAQIEQNQHDLAVYIGLRERKSKFPPFS